MPKGKTPTVVGEDLELLLRLRDEEGFSFSHIGRIMGLERNTVSNTWHRHHQTEMYLAAQERRMERMAQKAEADAGRRQINKLYEKEFYGADIRRLWHVLQGTSKLGGRL